MFHIRPIPAGTRSRISFEWLDIVRLSVNEPERDSSALISAAARSTTWKGSLRAGATLMSSRRYTDRVKALLK